MKRVHLLNRKLLFLFQVPLSWWLLLMSITVECAVLDPSLYLVPRPPLAATSDDIAPEDLWMRPTEARAKYDETHSDRTTALHEQRGKIPISTTVSDDIASGKLWVKPTETRIKHDETHADRTVASDEQDAKTSPHSAVSDDSASRGLWALPTDTRVERDATHAGRTTTPQGRSDSSTKNGELFLGSETFWPRFGPGVYGSVHIPLTFGISGTYGGYGTGGTGVVGSSYASVVDEPVGSFGSYGLAGSGYMSNPKTRIYGGGGGAAWSGWGNGKWGHYGKG